jgi:hypothetical protein
MWYFTYGLNKKLHGIQKDTKAKQCPIHHHSLKRYRKNKNRQRHGRYIGISNKKF